MMRPVLSNEQLRLTLLERREEMIDGLIRAGFRMRDDAGMHFVGAIQLQAPDEITVVSVELHDGFPYRRPTVTPLSRSEARDIFAPFEVPYREPSRTWHSERDNSMCLFEDSDHSRLPWADSGELLAQIAAWLDRDRGGWVGDPPALDLERYLPKTSGLLLYEDLRPVANSVVVVRPIGRDVIEVVSKAKVATGRRGRKARWPKNRALVVSVGQLKRPIRDWDSLLEAAGESAPRIQREVADGIRTLVVLYARGELSGVLTLKVESQGDAISLSAVRSAANDPESLRLRGHRRREEFATSRVAVLGVGAVGSVVADLLHRSGVGHLSLVDFDLLLPGNPVRHLSGSHSVGLPKVEAVAADLKRARPRSGTEVVALQSSVGSFADAEELLMQHDLVIDATADSTASPIVQAAAQAGMGAVVAVAVLADGYAARVDHWYGRSPAAVPTVSLPPIAPGVLENGCSGPLSTTPPDAIWEAAGMAARHALEYLSGDRECPGEERILWPNGRTQP